MPQKGGSSGAHATTASPSANWDRPVYSAAAGRRAHASPRPERLARSDDGSQVEAEMDDLRTDGLATAQPRSVVPVVGQARLDATDQSGAFFMTSVLGGSAFGLGALPRCRG
jgi:hypothetical protein